MNIRNRLISRELAAVVFLWLLVAGCSYSPDWPDGPDAVWGPPSDPSAVMWRPDGASGPQYVQEFRDGVKRRLYIDRDGGGNFELLSDLDSLNPAEINHVFVFLDGVPYRLFEQMYNEGAFRLFQPPARMIAPFPSITDISYSNIFAISGASAYESVVYSPRTNELHGGTKVYLAGDNEVWASRLDYRQTLWMDGVSYIFPMFCGRREFSRMFTTADEILRDKPEQRNILVYTISTDAACHTVGWDKSRQLLADLDRWIEWLMYRSGGRIGVVLFADHGNNFVPDCQRVDIESAMLAAGLTPVLDRGFRKPGEVVVPRYGLISLMRAFCQNEDDRQKLIDTLLTVEGVEHVMWRAGDGAFIRARTGLAEIRRHVDSDSDDVRELFAYRTIEGDPLGLLDALAGLTAHHFGDDPLAYYDAADLLVASADSNWPDALWRVWHGMSDQTALVPDVAASLAPGWYYGSPGLDKFAELNGTHGGLRAVDSITFFTTTMFQPPPLMRTVDVAPVINQYFPWIPPTDPPCCHGIQKYLDLVGPTGGLQHLRE